MVEKTLVIAHGDLDGIATAAITKHNVENANVELISVGRFPDCLEQKIGKRYRRLIVADLCPNPSQTNRVIRALKNISKETEVLWFDHHLWPSKTINEVLATGAKLVLDTERVAAEIALDEIGDHAREIERRLAEIARDADLLLNEDTLAVKWRRLLHWNRGRWRLKYMALNAFIEGVLWPDWAEKTYRTVEKLYRRELRQAHTSTLVTYTSGIRVAFTTADERLDPGDVQLMLRDKGFRAEVYVILHRNSVSLRSKHIDVSRIARILGGGGHKWSAGAPLRGDSGEKIRAVISAIEKALVREV